MQKYMLSLLLGLVGVNGFAFAHEHQHKPQEQSSMHVHSTEHKMHEAHHGHEYHTMPLKASATTLVLNQCWGRFREEGPSAAYVDIQNNDKEQAAYITGVKSASFAEAMLHESYEKDGMTGMRHVSEIEIGAGQSLSLTPGAYHVMLFKPQHVKEGDKVSLTFTLSNGHELSAECLMKSIASRTYQD